MCGHGGRTVPPFGGLKLRNPTAGLSDMRQQGKIRLVVAGILLAGALGLYLYSERAGRDAGIPAPPPADPRPPTPPQPVATYPVPESGPAPRPSGETPETSADTADAATLIRSPLPPLSASDAPLRAALEAVVDPGVLGRWLRSDRIIERTVVVVDSLDGPALPLRFRPLEPVPGLPVVGRSEQGLVLNAANADRYTPVIEAMESAPPADLAAVYFRFYPLFQQAYANLGYPDGYFNDRVMAIIDHLLATSLPAAPLALQRPEVLYEFSDPELESRSWGRKILMRMGRDNANRVQDWLRALRGELAGEGAVP